MIAARVRRQLDAAALWGWSCHAAALAGTRADATAAAALQAVAAAAPSRRLTIVHGSQSGNAGAAAAGTAVRRAGTSRLGCLQFCAIGRRLDERLAELGAKRWFARGDADGDRRVSTYLFEGVLASLDDQAAVA